MGAEEAFERGAVSDVRCDALDLCVTEVVADDLIQERQPIQRRENAIAADPALLQDGLGKSLSEEPRSARDQDLHLFRYALQSLWVKAVE